MESSGLAGFSVVFLRSDHPWITTGPNPVFRSGVELESQPMRWLGLEAWFLLGGAVKTIRQLPNYEVINLFKVYVVPPQSWGDRSDTKHSKCLLLGGRRLNQLTLIPKPKGSGGTRAATAQVGPANNRNDTKRCLPVEASLRPGEAVPW